MKSNADLKREYERAERELNAKQSSISRLQQEKARLQQQNSDLSTIANLDTQIRSLQQEVNRLSPSVTSLQREYNELVRENQVQEETNRGLENQLAEITREKNEYDEMLASLDSVLSQYSEFVGHRLDPALMVVRKLPRTALTAQEGTALKDACEKQSIKAFDTLLEKMDDINAGDSEGRTLLMYSLKHGFWYGVDKLLSMGADVNLADKNGFTTLMYACSMPHMKYINHVLENSEDVVLNLDKKNTLINLTLGHLRNGSKIYFYPDELELISPDLKEKKYHEVIICKCCPRPEIVQKKYIKLLETYINQGADINARDITGKNAYMTSLSLGLYDLAQWILDQPSFVYDDQPDSRGNTNLTWTIISKAGSKLFNKVIENSDVGSEYNKYALHFACKNRAPEAVKVLLENGAKPDVFDEWGKQPVHLCFDYMNGIYKNVTKVLAQYGIKVTDKSKEGYSLLHYGRCGIDFPPNMPEKKGYEILKNGTPSDEDSTLLHQAISIGWESLIDVLLNGGFKLSDIDKNGEMAFRNYMSTDKIFGRRKIFLLKQKQYLKNCDWNNKDAHGFSISHYIKSAWSNEILKILGVSEEIINSTIIEDVDSVSTVNTSGGDSSVFSTEQ